MPTDRWHRLESLFAEAAEQPASTRAAFVGRACGPDDNLRQDLLSLLAAAERTGDFLCTPALDVFARQVVREGWTVQPGDRIGAYTVERRLGAGAVGEVWRARDERLARDVAIKLLLPHPASGERGRAFEQEARAAGTLNHNNVLTVYDVGDYGGAPYLVTECLEGESLRARLAAGALSVDAALDVALQVARGLGAAHARHIVHRDLKPENIFLALDGRVKILDFGLAALLDAPPPAPNSPTPAAGEMRTLAAGTVGYMAPEQVMGVVVDHRADIFALGVVLYEMLAGSPPFRQGSALGTLEASLRIEPPDLAERVPGVPPALARIVRRCLAKSPDDRFATVAALETELESSVRERTSASSARWRALVRRPAILVPILLAIVAIAAAAWQWHEAASRARWARTVAAPEIQRLSTRGEYAEAFILARLAIAILPDDPHLRQLWLDLSVPAVMHTDPEGADVAFAAYRAPGGWSTLGRTPLNGVRIPRTLIRLRVSRDGFQPIEGTGSPGALNRYRLDPAGTIPPGMVRVTGGRDPLRFGSVPAVDDFWIDRFEITNRQFKAFVDQGGYRRRDYWHEPFVDAGRSVSWEQAVNRFRDASGQPGPATWTAGSYPDGQADFPVGGVSWYEAAAYAAFAGKSLPTIYHWYRAADLGRFSDILAVSNFGGKGPSPVGSHAGLGPFGTVDMAGNVKEWCWNAHRTQRYLLGGAWNEPMYMFADDDARGAFERAPEYGFRLVKYIAPVSAAAAAPVPVEITGRGSPARKPVGDDVFAAYRRQYAYDAGPLNVALEASEDSDVWVKQTIAYDAAYGGERVRAFLFLPKTGAPPYQTVIFFPAADAFQLRSSRDMSLAAADFIVRSGRAFMYPVYKGTYERAAPDQTGPNGERDLNVAWARDLGRTIDYLETRSDIDRARLAFYGVSVGGDAGVILSAVEPRLSTTILQGTAVGAATIPELDLANYAPRVRIPALMLNGRYDFAAPLDTQQRLFSLLGSRPDQKRHVAFDTGHALPVEAVAGEIASWLDRFLGPVAVKGG